MKSTVLISFISCLSFIIHAELLFGKNTSNVPNKVITEKNPENKKVKKADKPPIIDGKKNDACWDDIEWELLNQRWLGEPYDMNDFSGRYKLTWDSEALYLMVQIMDDVLCDQYPDPFKLWWDDDCIEIFIDADNSGGNHQYSHNAFAYHVALDHNVVDLSTEKTPILFNEHIETAHVTQGKMTIWEHKIYLYDAKTYKEGYTENPPLKLKANQEVGFALAYCDNDGSKKRENFIGSVYVEGKDKNQGYITADIFQTIILNE